MPENFDPTNPELIALLGDNPDARVKLGELKPWTDGQQTQYLVPHLGCCGTGLAFEGDPTNYHAVTISAGDAPTFIANYLEHIAAIHRGDG